LLQYSPPTSSDTTASWQPTKREHFADSMAEDLITVLSKISDLFVISRNSAFTYKGKAAKVHQVTEDLGVQYVLEGRKYNLRIICGSI
jgi:TolB-like protein